MEPLLRIVIISRRDTSQIEYEWIDDKWESDTNVNNTLQKLENTIARLLRITESLTYKASVKVIYCRFMHILDLSIV